MKEKTAITQFIDLVLNGRIVEALSRQDEFLELDRQQIMNAWRKGKTNGIERENLRRVEGDFAADEFNITASRYFTDTYEQPKEG